MIEFYAYMSLLSRIINLPAILAQLFITTHNFIPVESLFRSLLPFRDMNDKWFNTAFALNYIRTESHKKKKNRASYL